MRLSSRFLTFNVWYADRNLCPNTGQTLTKMKVVIRISAVFFLVSFQFAFSQSSFEKAKEEFTKLRNEYVANVNGDILFLLDESLSLWPDDFNREKMFVERFLNMLTVQADATRVEVIRFGNSADSFIDQVSNPAGTKNKCSFNEKFHGLQSRFAMWRNVKAAFQLAYDVCLGSLSGQKRGPLHQIKTTVILITDGYWNTPDFSDLSPVAIAQQLHAAGVQVFAIGVGYAPSWQLESVTRDPSNQAFLLQNFADLKMLALYIGGGTKTSIKFKLRMDLFPAIGKVNLIDRVRARVCVCGEGVGERMKMLELEA